MNSINVYIHVLSVCIKKIFTTFESKYQNIRDILINYFIHVAKNCLSVIEATDGSYHNVAVMSICRGMQLV